MKAPQVRIGTAVFAVLAASAVVLATLAAPAEAAKGGKKGAAATGDGGATLTVSGVVDGALALSAEVTERVTLAADGEHYVVSGSGFAAGAPVYLTIHEPFCCAATTVWADEDGSFTIERGTKTPGTYTVQAFQKRGSKLVLLASVSYDVVR